MRGNPSICERTGSAVDQLRPIDFSLRRTLARDESLCLGPLNRGADGRQRVAGFYLISIVAEEADHLSGVW